jgi:hypothetical protein
MAANNQSVQNTDAFGEPDAFDDPSGDTDDEQGAETEDGETSASALPLDQVFEVLKNQRRRTVLRYLDDHDEPVALGDLAEHVAALENDTPVAQISSRERKCAYVGLYQCHLPKMDDMDIVEFNQNRGIVESGPNIAQVERYLEWSDDETRPWPVYYLSVSLVGLLAVGLAQSLASPGLVTLGICVLLSLSVAGVAVAHSSGQS